MIYFATCLKSCNLAVGKRCPQDNRGSLSPLDTHPPPEQPIQHMTDNDNATSSFLPPERVEVSAAFTCWKELPSAGFNRLVRAKRYGRWWLLKGLKAEYGSQTLYQLLLRKEFELMSQLSHHGIAMVHSLEEVEGLGLAIVMEWIDGETLASWLARRPRRADRLRVALQLTDVLDYIHGRQIVHRDLKPQNIMVTENGGVVKLIDFGLSDADSYAMLKQPAGSAGYVSPEQRAGGKPDVRNDLYSLGCILQDLRLGVAARGVVRRCLRPIDRRYAHAYEVKAALQRSQRIPYYIIGIALVALLVLLLVAGGLGRTQRGTAPAPATETPSAEMPTDSLSDTKAAPETNTAATKTAADADAPAAETEVKATDATPQQTNHRALIQRAISEGKQKVDRELAASDEELKARIDTLTYVCHIEPRMKAVLHETALSIGRYATSFDAELGDDYSSTEIENALLLYVNEHYYQRWVRRIEERHLPQRPI